MVEAIRKDSFQLPHLHGISPGCVILRTNPSGIPNPYLSEIVVTQNRPASAENNRAGIAGAISDPELFQSIEDGDIGFIGTNGHLRVILSRKANHNTLLVTERCDNRCLFCSQPPKERMDDYLLVQAGLAIAAFQPKETIGISGGEPLLYQDQFLRFFDFVIQHAPTTTLHILSNGRAFAKANFTEAIAKRCQNLTMTFGVPLYSTIATRHDELVGATGAFQDTVKGLINAGNSGIAIELRIIPTRQNYRDIALIIEFSARCLSNIVQISIMNLEPTGWAKKNWDNLYLSPSLYVHHLTEAIETAGYSSLPVSLFNFPLCHLPEDLRPFAVQSISDWKNFYPEECSFCRMKADCTGFFTSSKGRFHQSPRRIPLCVSEN